MRKLFSKFFAKSHRKTTQVYQFEKPHNNDEFLSIYNAVKLQILYFLAKGFEGKDIELWLGDFWPKEEIRIEVEEKYHPEQESSYDGNFPDYM